MRKPRRGGTAADQLIPIEGLSAPVKVRRHPSARRMTLRVSRTHRAVIVTLPPRCCMEAAGSFVSRHIEWVRERLENMPPHVPFCDGVIVPLRGMPHLLSVPRQHRRGSVVTVVQAGSDGDELPSLVVSGGAETAPRRLVDWLVAEARRDLEAAVVIHAGRLDVRPKRIAVRDQASRWGSCSTTGVLSFSWRLILAPPWILDYVAAHEVAHLREMNHGPRFWALVEQTFPELREARRWLRAHGMELHRYG